MLETEQGLRLLKESRSSLPRLEFEERVKGRLLEQGYQNLDITYKNNRDEYFTKDAYRNNWLVKQWYCGPECDIKDSRSVIQCAGHLGRIHQLMRLGSLQETDYVQKEGLKEEMERHNRELKRVRGYIRGKKQKNEMEICLLNSFDTFYEQAGMAQTILQESAYDEIWCRTLSEGRVCHGSYTYHNVLFSESGIVTTYFDKAEIGIQIRDLYDFLRKVMEKNCWKSELGQKIIQEYQKEYTMEKGEGEILYTLLLYPEKYWKLVNFYYNGRKSWMPAKNLEKLLRIRTQEKDRMEFLEEVKGLLI